MSDDRLRELWQQDDAPAGDCPDDARIFDAVAGRLHPDEVAPIVDHIAVCGACATSWRMARALTDGPGAQVQQATPSANGSRWLGVGAVLLAMAAGLLLVVGTGEPPAVYRDGPEAVAWEGATAEPVEDGIRLSFQAPAPGATYRIRVATEALETVTVSPWLDVPEWTVRPSALDGVAPGAILRWQVEATWPDGRVLRSPSWELRMP